MTAQLEILHRDSLREGGFAGLREHRLVQGRRVFGAYAEPDTWDGLGSFVYLADARFLPHGETRLHDHREVDVISLIVEGRISHEGSLGAGEQLGANQVQVQRAGGEGFSHNEINPDPTENRMIQLWVLPEHPGEPAGYKVYDPVPGGATRVYGGLEDAVFPSHTAVDVALVDPGGTLSIPGEFIAYVTKGDGEANDTPVTGGHILRGHDLDFRAETDAQLIVIHIVD